ncbi:TRAF-like family protein [Corchorus olitorius]|uniref:TRAF-like family protein n=1 Tax=Corchorus olitorius TaxID=93759 RepID=A0A1R3K0S1_9ROSI|nr:TRAF-like family protein [Corchorus olitorius]
MKTEVGFAQFLSLESFKDACNGYLFDDSCVFGAEISVFERTGNWEQVSIVKNPVSNNKLITLKFENLSKAHVDRHYSSAVTLADANCHKAFFQFSCAASWGYAKVVTLEDLHDASKGYIKNDSSIVQVEFTVIRIRRTTREFPPSHYLFKVESFSLLAKSGVEKYESDAFEAAGHKWRLALYPNGDTKSNGSGFISLYLVIDETEDLPLTWEVHVSFRLFVLDQIHDKYLTIEDADGTIKRFHWMKTEWGFAQFLSFEIFNDSSNGYLVGDGCIFGAEVFLMERNCKWECLSMIKEPEDNTIAFKLEGFSKLDRKYYESSVHTIGDSKWKLTVYPKGNVKFKGRALSVFLELVEAEKLPPKRKVYAEYKLRARQMTYSAMETMFHTSGSSSSSNEEIVRYKRDIPPAHYTFRIEGFSLLLKSKVEKIESAIFEAGGYKWKLKLFPQGIDDEKVKGDWLSLYFWLCDSSTTLPPKGTVYADFKLRVLDQRRDQHVQKSTTHWFTASSHFWGWKEFIRLGNLHERSKGFVMNDTLKVQVQVNVISVTKCSK